MKAEVGRSVISGTVRAPSSKSAMQRYIAGALLAKGTSTIESVSMCDDSDAALSIAGRLGAAVTYDGNRIIISGGFSPVSNEISCGESGLSARMFTPIAALHDKEIRITGRGSVLKRPLDMVEMPLRNLGVDVVSEKGYLPLTVKGPLKGGKVAADGSLSSQFITGLLMALPVVEKDSIITVDKLVSRPYIDLTLGILDEFGIGILNEDYSIFRITGRQSYRPGIFSPEGDWSGAAFLLIMGAIGGSVTVEGLKLNSVQADKAVLKALEIAGIKPEVSGSSVMVKKDDLHGFEFDISDCPDLAPPLTVLSIACKGRTILHGAQRLIAKESNRGEALEVTMRALGADVTFTGETVVNEGGKQIEGGEADAHNDHRIAMALATAALVSRNPVMISGMECISKSYPGFISDYRRINGNTRVL